jgi:asparagine synthase (glutamine-hydrolysing)
VPFLDYRLVEFMSGVSKNVKMNGYERKSVLRNTVGKQLPRSVLRASKKGFSVPIKAWFRGNEFERQLRALYEQDFGLNSGIIREIVTEHKEGMMDSGNFIWMLMVLKHWNDGRNVQRS